MSDWRFDVEDVGEEPEPTLEPGEPSAEGVLFFLLGVVLALYTFAALF